MKLRAALLIALASTLVVRSASGEDWWQFRGPSGNGHSEATDVPITWGGFFEKPLWTTSIPGRGWSSPIVTANRVWLTSSEIVALEESKAEKKIASRPYGASDFQTHASVTLFAIELDADTGEILRRIDLFNCSDPPPIHAWNSYASPTPVTDGNNVYCHFGALGTACIEIKSGRVLWRRQLKTEEITGGAASPVLWHDQLFVACDGADEQYVISVDKQTGETRWRTDRPNLDDIDPAFKRASSTPLIIEGGGRTQLISMSAHWLLSIDPENGREWWRAKVASGYSAVPRPILHNEKVIVCTGYSKPEMVALNINGNGDVTETHILWRARSQVPEVASPIVVNDQIYFVTLGGVATSLNASTGEKIWQHRMDGSFAASPTYANGHLYFTSMEGETTVIRPGRTYDFVAKNQLFGESYASLAVYRNQFLLRTGLGLFCLPTSKSIE
jgi:outer membrane protein assembly factor BamB